MFKYKYEPRPSVYVRAQKALKQKSRLLTREEAENCLKVTPGIAFADGITFDDVLNTMETWKLIRIKNNLIEVS